MDESTQSDGLGIVNLMTGCRSKRTSHAAIECQEIGSGERGRISGTYKYHLDLRDFFQCPKVSNQPATSLGSLSFATDQDGRPPYV